MKNDRWSKAPWLSVALLLLAAGVWGAIAVAAQPQTCGVATAETSGLGGCPAGPVLTITSTSEPAGYMPIMLNQPTLTPTATPTATPPADAVVNGDFESGSVGWGQYSSNGWALILPAGVLPFPPYSGEWAAWLGGDHNEVSILSQVVTVPGGNPTLTYWHWIASEDSCGGDAGGVVINGDIAVDAYLLCADNNTNGWVRRDINLAAFTGQSVELAFAVSTNSSLHSNWLVDLVSLGSGSRPVTTPGHVVASPALISKPQAGLDTPAFPHLPGTAENDVTHALLRRLLNPLK